MGPELLQWIGFIAMAFLCLMIGFEFGWRMGMAEAFRAYAEMEEVRKRDAWLRGGPCEGGDLMKDHEKLRRKREMENGGDEV